MPGAIQARAAMVSQMLALVLVAASTVSCSRDSGATRETHGPAPARDWVFVYYLSYDNDLSTNTPVVLKALRAGAGTGEVAVAALVDDADRSGMVRFVITGNGSTEERSATEDSASIQVLSNYLGWVKANLPARHYGIVFADHGGRLDEMCLDEWADGRPVSNWLSARAVGALLRQFREEAPGKVDLVFLQQCGRASIQNLYNFRAAAEFVMASQLTVGAPNAYYAPTLEWLNRHPEATGREVARRIMDSDDKFNNYVCVDGKAIGELPGRLDLFLAGLLDGRRIAPPRQPIQCFKYGDEANYDLFSWIDAVHRDNRIPATEGDTFKEWVRGKLIVGYAVQRQQTRELAPLCGLSVFVPENVERRNAYREYPFHSAGRLVEFWEGVSVSSPAK